MADIDAGSPGELLARKRSPLQIVDVEGVAQIAEVEFVAIVAGIVSVQRDTFFLALRSLPAPQDVTAREAGRTILDISGGGGVSGNADALAEVLVVQRTLQGEVVTGVVSPVHAKPGLTGLPGIVVVPSG